MEVSGQLHAPAALLPGKETPTQPPPDCVDTRIGLDVLGRIDISWACRESNPDFSIIQLVARRCTDCAIQATGFMTSRQLVQILTKKADTET
jgi:hypothetical protein